MSTHTFPPPPTAAPDLGRSKPAVQTAAAPVLPRAPAAVRRFLSASACHPWPGTWRPSTRRPSLPCPRAVAGLQPRGVRQTPPAKAATGTAYLPGERALERPLVKCGCEAGGVPLREFTRVPALLTGARATRGRPLALAGLSRRAGCGAYAGSVNATQMPRRAQSRFGTPDRHGRLPEGVRPFARPHSLVFIIAASVHPSGHFDPPIVTGTTFPHPRLSHGSRSPTFRKQPATRRGLRFTTPASLSDVRRAFSRPTTAGHAQYCFFFLAGDGQCGATHDTQRSLIGDVPEVKEVLPAPPLAQDTACPKS